MARNYFFRYSLLFVWIMLSLNYCVSQKPSLVQEGSTYFLSSNKNIQISFSQSLEVNTDILNQSLDFLVFLLKKIPHRIFGDIFIEGLVGEPFYDFMLSADTLCDYDRYLNKTILYAYFSALYEEFMISKRQYPFIPLIDFQKLFTDYKINIQNNAELLGCVVTYAVEEVYFVSILELLERPERYFYPKKVSEELYRVLIYPEILSFWHYMEKRFGKKLLLMASEKVYTPEHFQITFSENISNLEASYLKSLAIKGKDLRWLSPDLKKTLDDMLFCYMSGTKKRLFTE